MLLRLEVQLASLVLLIALATPTHADRKHLAVLELDGPRAANLRVESQ